MGRGAEIEVETATDLCGSVLFSSPGFGSFVAMKDEIGVGETLDPCGGVPPLPSPYNPYKDHTLFENRYPNVEAYEATDNDTSANEGSLETIDNVCRTLKNLRSKNTKGLIFGYLNINSVRNKFEFLKPVAKSFDLLTIAETKIDDSFPTSQFLIEGFMRPFRHDRNKNGGGLLTYARDGAPIKQLNSYNFPDDIEAIVIEINLRKQKWLVIIVYRPPSQCPKYFFDEIEKGMDFFSSKYENYIVTGDFNCEVNESIISDFMDSYNLYNIIKGPTCFKSDNPRCIDLILTNRKHNFQNTTTAETGLSDFHAMVVSMLKGGFNKRGPRVITYCDYSAYCDVAFRTDLMNHIRSDSSDDGGYDAFGNMVTDVLLQHAPIKKKYLRANDGPFMTRELRKEMMHRTRFLNKYNKDKTNENFEAYKRQRNKCVKMLRKAKFNYYKDLDLNNLTDNRKFWKIVKPVFTDKVQVS